MKSIKNLVIFFMLFASIFSRSQVSINVNFGTPIASIWYSNCPANVQYYYLPEIECYFDVHQEVYIYYGPNGWTRSPYLPNYCSNYVINSGYYYPIEYCGATPYVYYNNHCNQYYKKHYRNYRNEYYGNANAYGRRAQMANNNERYYQNRPQNNRSEQVVYQNSNKNYYQQNLQQNVNRYNRNSQNYQTNNSRGNAYGRR